RQGRCQLVSLVSHPRYRVLNLHAFLPHLRPADCIQKGGDALRADPPDLLEYAIGGGTAQTDGIGRTQIVMDACGDGWAEAWHLELEQGALLRRQIITQLLVERQRVPTGQRADLGGQAFAQARQAQRLAGGDALGDRIAHAQEIAGGAAVGADAVGVALLSAEDRGYVEQNSRDFTVGHSSTSLFYSCLRYVVVVR